MTGESRPLQSIFAFLDPLLSGPTLVGKPDDVNCPRTHVGDNESHTGEQFAAMSFNLGHHSTRPVPGRRLIGETGEGDDGFLRRSPDGTLQQVGNRILQNVVGRQPDGVLISLLFEIFVKLRFRESRISTKESLPCRGVSSRDGFQDLPPVGRTVHLAYPQQSAFKIAELVEAEQRMITGAFKVAVVRSPFLPPMRGADRTIHVENDLMQRLPLTDSLDPAARQVHEFDQVFRIGLDLCLEPPDLPGGCGRFLRHPSTNGPPHGRIDAKPFGVVGFFVTGQTTVDGLPQQCLE